MRFSKLARPALLATALAPLGCALPSAPSGHSGGGGVHLCLDGCPIDFGPIEIPGSVLPAPVAGGLSFKTISLGYDHVCAVAIAGDAYCWGAINFGSQSYHLAKSPERVPGDFKFDTISVGNALACGITTDKRTMCWGANDAGQIGNGFYGENVSMPTAVVGPDVFKSIAVGGWDVNAATGGNIHSSFACGLTTAGRISCWGTNTVGQLGSGIASSNVLYVAPQPVAGNHTFTALAGNGFATTCALEISGAAFCWGKNDFGELGTATGDTAVHAPTRVASNLTFVALSARYGTCGVTATKDTYCWGSAGVVNVSSGSPLTPRLITSMPFVSVVAGGEHACGLTSIGAAYCWGYNYAGQLGDGTKISRSDPVPVATELRFVRIAAGMDQTCALTADGAAYCWGSDGSYSMLGRGT